MFLRKTMSYRHSGMHISIHPGYLQKSLLRLLILLLFSIISFISFSQGLRINNARFVVKGNSSLVINNGAFINNGSFSAGDGTVIFSGPADSTKSYISGSANTTYNNLSIQKPGATVATKSRVIITDTVSVTGGFLYSNNYLVLNSDSSGTAMVNTLPVDGSGQPTASILGVVSVERYIPARKAWRLLAAPVRANGAPSVSASWQEGSTTASSVPNPNPGYGTHITGGTISSGYDQGPTINTSIKIYNAVTNSWTGLPSSGTASTPVSDYPGYFLYVRGDRSVNLAQGVNLTPSATRLRINGELKTGTQSFAVNASNFTVVGNPYASPIDFHSILKTNVGDKLYIWDPKMSGQYGLGAYVTLSWNDNTSSYDATSSISPVSRYIPSGEAFLVTSLDGTSAGNLTVRESDKNNLGSDQVFGFTARQESSLRIDLYKVSAGNESELLDGALVTFNDDNSNNLDEKDAIKAFSSGELIGIIQQGKVLSIERRRPAATHDTIFLQQSQMRLGNYKMVLELTQMARPGMKAFLKDNFNPDSKTLLDMQSANELSFSIINNPGSYAGNRFYIVFEELTVVPVRFIDVKAAREESKITINWAVENEAGSIGSYTIQKSLNGVDFTDIQNTAADNSVRYTGNDYNPSDGSNFYRIRAMNRNGNSEYSAVVLVEWKNNDLFKVYPNPVTGKKINVEMTGNNLGWYYRLLNLTGEIILQGNIRKGISRTSINIPQSLSAGVYEFEMKPGTGEKKTIRLFIN